MFFDGFKGLVADVVLYLTCVFRSGALADTEIGEQRGEQCMALINLLSDGSACIGECQTSVLVDQYETVLTQEFDRSADAGL